MAAFGGAKYKPPYVQDGSASRESRGSRDEPPAPRPIEKQQSSLVAEGAASKAGKGKAGKGKGAAVKGGKGSGGAVMSVEATSATIAKIYAARVQADAWAKEGRDSAQPVARFDAFVMRYFKRACGTRGVARRTLRSFVASLEAHGGGGDLTAARDGSRDPRIVVFCALSGVGQVDGEFNPRLLPTYMLPALRVACPEPRMAARALEKRGGNPVPVDRKVLLEAIRAPTEEFLGRSFVDRFCAAAPGFREKSSTPGSNTVDLDDRALVTALELWIRADRLWVIEQQRGARVLIKFVRAHLERKASRMEPLPPDGDSDPPREGAADVAEASTTRRKIESARDLDSALNLYQQKGLAGL
jgi:hypothetical protein